MGVLIQLTALKRNDKTFTKNILVDVNDIVTPIIENASNNSIIEVDTDISYGESYFGNFEKYEVSQDLAAIKLLTNELFLGTIDLKNDKPTPLVEALFIKSRIVGTIRPEGGSGQSIFDYKVMSSTSPETYLVAENLATINA